MQWSRSASSRPGRRASSSTSHCAGGLPGNRTTPIVVAIVASLGLVMPDDMISSGRTMLEAVRVIAERGAAKPICIAVHGLFADQSDKLLAEAGARVVTSNSVPHPTNDFDVGKIVADGISALLHA